MDVRKLKKVVIKEELYALTKDTVKAIILGQFIYWQERVKDIDKFIEEEKERCLNDSIEFNLQPQNGWIYKKSSELAEDCMLNLSEVTIRRHIQEMIDCKFLFSRKNPIHKWDRTMQYRVNMSYIISEIKNLGYDGLSGFTIASTKNEATNLQNEGSMLQIEGAITDNTNIDYNTDKKEDTNVSKKSELFEECWKLYGRKGSKKNSKAQWNKMSIDEMELAKFHIQAYVQSVSDKKYQKDFERYLRDKIFNNVVYKGNTTIFDPEQINNDGEYRPQLDGFNLVWNEKLKCYISMYDISMLFDGYNDNNRPSSAVVMKNGVRYKWNTENKKWEAQ